MSRGNNEMTIDTRHTDNVVCPHCGHENRDSWELNDGEEGIWEHECGSCEEQFECIRHVSVTYSTRKREQAA